MAVSHRIRATKAVTLTDYLGGDSVQRGEKRTDSYPAVEVEFFDTITGDVLASATYVLRPRSAIETMDDVTAAVQASIADVTAMQAAPIDAEVVPVLSRDAQALVDQLDLSIGKTVAEAAAAVRIKP